MPIRTAGPDVHRTLSHRGEELERTKAISAEAEHGYTATHVDRGIETYIERCRIPSFVAANFSLGQTWKLQRPTLWADLTCAPVNGAWALPHLAVRKMAESAEKVGYPQLARWEKRLPSGIKTGCQRRIEGRICRDVLEWDRQDSRANLPQGFLKELVPVPSWKKRMETLELERLLHRFSSGRAIVSDHFAPLLALATGWAIMGDSSLSLTNLAHGVARKSAHDRAAFGFFLEKNAGSAFSNVFPTTVNESTTWTVFLLLGDARTADAMACTILSDLLLRKALCFHHHRLGRCSTTWSGS